MDHWIFCPRVRACRRVRMWVRARDTFLAVRRTLVPTGETYTHADHFLPSDAPTHRVLSYGCEVSLESDSVLDIESGFGRVEPKENPSACSYEGLIAFPLVRTASHERNNMYLSELDIVAISIALVSLMALVVSSAVANARLTRRLSEWRSLALSYERERDDV